MNLEEYVLTAKDENGKIIINVADYYEQFVKPLDPRFKWSFSNSSTVLCCWKDHTDVNPSLGTMRHRFYKGVYLYHCLGCGATGTVIRMHQRIQKEYFGRDISDKESCLELCDLFGVDATAYKEIKDIGAQTNFVERVRKTCNFMNTYTIRDFSGDLLRVRKNKSLSFRDTVNAINTASIKYIATSKQLYD